MAINRLRYYLGPLGFLQPLPPLLGGTNAPEVSMFLPGGMHLSIGGRITADRVGTPKRSWVLTYQNLLDSDRLLLDSILYRGNGGAPLRLIDPRVSNRLTADASTGGTVSSGTSAFSTTGYYDLFTRTVSNDWSNLTSGQAWTEVPGTPSGTINDFDVNGSVGTIAIQANLANYMAVVSGVTTDTVDQQFDFAVPFTDVTGATLEVGGLIAKYLDINTHLLARLVTSTAETFTLEVFRVGGTGGTALLGGPVAISGSNVAGTFMTIRMQAIPTGIGTIVRAKAWPTAGSPGAGWQITGTDTNLTLPGQFGIRSSIGFGNTNAKPIVVSVDSYRATLPTAPTSVLSYVPGLVPTALQGVLAGGLQWTAGFAGHQLLATDELVPVIAGSVYQFSAYVSGNANVKLIARTFDSAGLEQGVVASSAQTVTGTMTRFSWLYTPAGGVAGVQFGLEAQTAGSLQTTAWKVGIDESSLTPWSFGAGCPVVVPDNQIPATYWRAKYWQPKLTLREA